MKQKSISFRVSEKEYEQISQRANESNQSVSKYVLNSALAGNGITLQQKQEIYKNLCIMDTFLVAKAIFNTILSDF